MIMNMSSNYYWLVYKAAWRHQMTELNCHSDK